MKKSILFILMAVAQVINAQQLPNSTFDGTWEKCYPWAAGIKASTAKGTQPEGWCVSNVSDVKVSIFSMNMPILGTESTGASGNGKSVKLTNSKVSGNVLPAYITLGTTYATAETKTMETRNEDGGLFGGIAFNYHPDAVRITYKCDRSGGENEKMTFIAYLWKGTWTQKDVPSNTAIKLGSWGEATKVTMYDRIHNILGKTAATGGEITKTTDAALVAKIEYYSNEKVNTWTTKDFILDYGEFAGKPVDVEKLNIVISANNLFGSKDEIKEKNSVTFDDVVLVYWHALSALSYEGATLNFSENTTNYDLSSLPYDESKLSYTVKGQAATATKSYNAETKVLTIRVEGEDIASNPSSFTEYTIQFGEPVPQVVSSKTYSEDLYLTIAGQTNDKQPAAVMVENLDNGKFNFVLKNFILGSGDEAMPVGNIVVENLSKGSDGSFTFNGGIQLLNGDDPAYAGQWLGPQVTQMCGGSVPLNLSGKFIGEDHVVVYIAIDLTNIMGYAVDVHLGYARALMAVNAEAQYGTFCAPFAMAIPSDVQAYTVSSATNGQLTLSEVTTSNIPANTPVVLYAENGLTTVEAFGVAVSGTPTVGLLTGVYEDTDAPAGSYVLQNKSGKVGFYIVVPRNQSPSVPTVKANHAYLTKSGSNNVKAFYFNEDDATVINNINVNANEGTIYNVAGQRLNKMQKGINIINGKKILK